ncbi:MAG: hypothetical protein ACREAO_02830, partial [Nitrososphaera sp.]
MGQNSNLASPRAAMILVVGVLAISLVAFAPLQQSFAANGKTSKGQMWRGQIANVQLDSNGEPEWIQSGTWMIKKAGTPSPGKPNLAFLAQITMVKVDGTSLHKHRISNFATSSYEIGKGAVSVKGNATIGMKDGPVKNVPVSVSISARSVAISIDKIMVDNHFGTSPVYGVVSKVPSPITPQSYSGLSVSDSVTTSKSTNSNSTSASTSPETSSSNSTSNNSTSNNSTSNNSTSNNSTSNNSTSNNSTQNASSSNSTSTSTPPSSPPPANPPSSNSTAPPQSSPTATTVSLAARSATDLYSWFSGNEENPTLRFTANSDVTIAISNETDRKHKLVIQSEDGTQLAASDDVLVGQSG